FLEGASGPVLRRGADVQGTTDQPFDQRAHHRGKQQTLTAGGRRNPETTNFPKYLRYQPESGVTANFGLVHSQRLVEFRSHLVSEIGEISSGDGPVQLSGYSQGLLYDTGITGLQCRYHQPH